MSTVTTFARLLVISACLILGTVARASASPITWMYSGAVTSSFNETLVPVGSPTTILLTVDPNVNVAAGFSTIYPNVGWYSYLAIISFTGREYTLRGHYEVNWDIGAGFSLPGQAPIRHYSLSGPSLDPGAPDGYDYRPQMPSCFNLSPCYWDWATANPTSSAFLGPFFVVPFRLYFVDPDGAATRFLSPIIVRGVNPQVVPEPSTLLLLSSGVLAVIAARRRKERA